jgi:uncharacterized phage protein (TIGR02218 family)
MTVFFSSELEGVATFWRVYRKDGVTLGFTSHDRALTFGGIAHRAAPGMLPTAVRRTNALDSDSAEASGALSHDSISEQDLAAGLFDHAQIVIGAVDWETLKHAIFYTGTIGRVEEDGYAFSTELISAKAQLDVDLVPRTSPTCRAVFCGEECGLSETRFTTRQPVSALDFDANKVAISTANSQDYLDGQLRFLDGPQTGVSFGIIQADSTGFTLDKPLFQSAEIATVAELREGCDHTVQTCAARFSNAANFRGEPHLPGNDLLARYPIGR